MATTFSPLYFNIDASGFAYPEPSTTADTLNIGKIAASGVGGIAMDGGSARISNVADPQSTQDVATYGWTNAQIAAALTGLSWKNAVKAATTEALPACTYANGTLGVGATLTADVDGALGTIDGVTLVAGVGSLGDRLLVKDETLTKAPYNGIYNVTALGDVTHPWILTRAVDNDVVAEMNQATVAIDQGTANKDTTRVQTNHPTTMGSDDILWVVGPSLTPYTASTGLQLVLSDFRVKAGDGIEVTSNSASTNVRLDATPGLEFTGSAGSGALRAKLDGSTLARGASGLSVAYAPSYQTTLTASGSISKGAGVYISGNGVVSQGDSSALAKVGLVGVAMAAMTNGNPGQIAQNGVIVTTVLTSATAGTPYYMGHAGVPILASALVSQDRAILLGYAYNATDLEVRIQDMGKKP